MSTPPPPTLPPISTVPDLDAEERAAILDLLFEPCTQLHTLAVSTLRENKTFGSYDDLVAAVGAQMTALRESALRSDREWLDKILNAHPRLGEKRVESELSRREQAAMMGGSGAGGVVGIEADEPAMSEEEMRKLNEKYEALLREEEMRKLNEKYEALFGDLRYVVFVNGRSRRVIMEDMERRIARGDIEQERRDAIQAMCEIASDRAKKLVAKS